ncbi:hypothetical protein FA95DRAFT_1577662, partial [Auriscalpium vulgare]
MAAMSWTTARRLVNRFLDLEAVVDEGEGEDFDDDDESESCIVPDQLVEHSIYDDGLPSAMAGIEDEAPLLHAMAAEFRRRAVTDSGPSAHNDDYGLLFAVRVQRMKEQIVKDALMARSGLQPRSAQRRERFPEIVAIDVKPFAVGYIYIRARALHDVQNFIKAPVLYLLGRHPPMLVDDTKNIEFALNRSANPPAAPLRRGQHIRILSGRYDGDLAIILDTQDSQ